MPNQHITEYLDYYIKSKNPEHAVMINGAWGSGKTWFIKNYIDNYKQPVSEDEIKFIHVSLYGLKTTEDIDNEIFRQAFPVLSSKPMVIGKAVAKGFIRGFLKIDIDGDGKADSQIKLVEMEGAFSTKDLSSDNLILIFDDAERTSIDTIELLGYINHFVEIQGYKAILISNEDALEKKWKKDGEAKYEKALHSYSEIKEKLVGKTLPINADYSEAIDTFISRIEHKISRQIFEDNKETIITVFTESKYNNLRSIKYGLWNFSRFIEATLTEQYFLNNKNFIRHILFLFLVYTIESRAGELDSIKQIQNPLFEYIAQEYAKKETNETNQNLKKYSSFDARVHIISQEAWDQILFPNRSLDTAQIHQEIKSTKYFVKENSPTWQQLWYFDELEDPEFNLLRKKLYSDLINIKIYKLPVLLHTYGLFLKFSEIKLTNYDLSSITDFAYKNADKILFLSEHNTNPNSTLPTDHFFGAYDGLGYFCREEDNFKKLVQYIKEQKRQAELSFVNQQAQNLLEYLKTNPTIFTDLICTQENDGKHFYNIPILHQISPEHFIEEYCKLTNIYKREINISISIRYDSHYAQELTLELPWLKSIHNLAKHQKEKHEGKVAYIHFQHLIENVAEAISKLEP